MTLKELRACFGVLGITREAFEDLLAVLAKNDLVFDLKFCSVLPTVFWSTLFVFFFSDWFGDLYRDCLFAGVYWILPNFNFLGDSDFPFEKFLVFDSLLPFLSFDKWSYFFGLLWTLIRFLRMIDSTMGGTFMSRAKLILLATRPSNLYNIKLIPCLIPCATLRLICSSTVAK